MKILSCGAGQQSTALALMSCEKAMSKEDIYPLVPIYDAILFCNLGGEREWVYRQVDFIAMCCKEAGIPFYVLKDENLKDDYLTNYGIARVCIIPFWSLDENGKKGNCIPVPAKETSVAEDTEEDALENYNVTLHETYEATYGIQAHSPKEAEELLREKIQEGLEDGPEECSNSWCDVKKI